MQNGRGVSRDHEQAVAWSSKAADQGNALAQYNLGLMYTMPGVAPDAERAAVWWRKAV
jgi:TPR repeat protein